MKTIRLSEFLYTDFTLAKSFPVGTTYMNTNTNVTGFLVSDGDTWIPILRGYEGNVGELIDLVKRRRDCNMTDLDDIEICCEESEVVKQPTFKGWRLVKREKQPQKQRVERSIYLAIKDFGVF